MILIKSRDDTKGELEEIGKERRNKDRTFGFDASYKVILGYICVMELAGRYRFIL